MQDNTGFVDLRVGHGAQAGGEDSVWPSFTDIMTVVVMIFLLSLVVMMVRNLELDRELVTTISAREASLLENKNLTKKLSSLELNMLDLQHSLGTSISERDELRTQLLAELKRIELLAADNVSLEDQLTAIIKEREQLSREKQTAEENLTQAKTQVDSLTANEERLSQKIGALVNQFSVLQLESGSEFLPNSSNLSLTERIDAASTHLEQVKTLLQNEQQQNRELSTKVEEKTNELIARQALLARLRLSQPESTKRDLDANEEIKKLNELIRLRQRENAALQGLTDTSSDQFKSLQEEYDSLNEKYRDLVRPARSPAGKHVVEVWIVKTDSDYRFSLKEPSQSTPTSYSKRNMEKRLESLKKKHSDNLYTKVIIPDNSQLSHSEAWDLTQEILRGYDYYYQTPAQ